MVNRVRDSRFDFSARKAGHSFLGLQCQPASHLPENSNGVQETHGFGKMDEFAKKNNSERPLDTECHKVLRILIVNELLTQYFVVKIFALFPQILFGLKGKIRRHFHFGM